MYAFTRDYNRGAYPHQRFGQAFCNVAGINNPALYYETNRKDAEDIAWGSHVGG
jgi:hypothetical protein